MFLVYAFEMAFMFEVFNSCFVECLGMTLIAGTWELSLADICRHFEMFVLVGDDIFWGAGVDW